MADQARALRDLGLRHALVKGGHLTKEATDVFVDESGTHLLPGRN